jgi:flagellar hook-associated protein 2
MSIGGLSGLASGVDTSGIVDQLMAIERQATNRLALRQSAVTARQTGLKDIATKLNALKAASQDLSSSTTWAAKQTVESSDASRVSAAMSGGAGIGGHSIQVDRLASSAQRGYAFTPSAAAGTIDLAYANDAASKVTIEIKAGATAADVATAINSKGDAPAFASVIKDPVSGAERLVLSARKTGRDSGFTLDAANLPAAVFDEKSEYSRSGPDLDAAYRLDGSSTVLYSKTNVIDNAMPGVKLTLKGVTTQPVSVSVSEPAIDQDAIKTKIKALVDAYNSVVTSARAKVTEKTVATATNSTDAAKGQLFGDTGLLSMLSSLRIRMGDRLTGLAGVDELSDIGIAVPKATGTASQDAKDGKLAIDDKKLTEMLTADASKVKALFTSFGAGLETFIKSQSGTGSILDSRDKAATSELKLLTGQVTRTNERIDAKEKRLKAQFAAMEAAMQNTQSQTAWLTGQINSLG